MQPEMVLQGLNHNMQSKLLPRSRLVPSIIAILITAKSLPAGTGVYAPASSADHSQAWCEGESVKSHRDAVAYRDGGVVQVGPHYFRVCRELLSPKPDGKRAMRFYYNPRRVEGLSFDKSMIGLMVSGIGTWERALLVQLTNSKRVERVQFGDATYLIYRSIVGGDPYREGAKFLVYDPIYNRHDLDAPLHIVTCTKDFELQPEQSVFCFLRLGYNQISASLLFLGGGPDVEPIPMELFPAFAQDIVRILQTADVTEEVTAGTINLPRLDK